MGILKNLWQEIAIPFKVLCYNEKIEEIRQRHNPPASCGLTEHTEYQRMWQPVLDDLLEFAQGIKLPMYHLYKCNDNTNSQNVIALVRNIREYAQARFGQLIGLFAIIISSITLVTSVVAIIVAFTCA